MTAADITRDVPYADLAGIFRENCEPFSSIEQCDLLLRVGSILRQMVPEEADHGGERIRTRDIEVAMAEARKAKAVFGMTSQAATVIVPPDCLR